MQLVVRDGTVLATHDDDQSIAGKYPGCEVALFNGTAEIGSPDPRTPEEKACVYRDQRRAAYPPIADQLDMLYWDAVNGTATWRDAVATVKARFPK